MSRSRQWRCQRYAGRHDGRRGRLLRRFAAGFDHRHVPDLGREAPTQLRELDEQRRVVANRVADDGANLFVRADDILVFAN